MPTDCGSSPPGLPPPARGFGARLKTRQKHPFKSKQHRESYDRRTAVERAFGDVKSEAGEDVGPGRIRLFGRTKQMIMRTFAYVARNLRIIHAFDRREPRQVGNSSRRKLKVRVPRSGQPATPPESASPD